MTVCHQLVRRSAAALAAVAAIALAGCETDNPTSMRHMKPLSSQVLADFEKKNMDKESPILVRIFKQESELEVWKQDRTGKFALLRNYPVCRWSGELGPKVKEGDRQAPEGFYTVTPGQMNPNSQYHLAFNMGFPNAYDKAHGRSGAHLMVHGDCSSRGCYAMTDEQISEIYALGRESFFGGQQAFQIHAFPFRMTAANFAKHRSNPNLAFWRMLKEGYDHFEVSRLEPQVDVCEKRYVFNATPTGGGTFNAVSRCPAYEVPQEIAAPAEQKRKRDEAEFAELVRKNIPIAPIATGQDGGMHPVFLAKMKPGQNEDLRSVFSPAPGTIPAHAVPPGPREPASTGSVMTAAARSPAAVPAAPAAVANRSAGSSFSLASVETRPAQSPNGERASAEPSMFDKVKGWIGLGEEPKPSAKPASPTRNANATPTPPAKPKASEKSQPVTAFRSEEKDGAELPVRSSLTATPQSTTLPGAQPVVPADNFSSRWGAFR